LPGFISRFHFEGKSITGWSCRELMKNCVQHCSCKDSRRSTSGYLFVLGSRAISWSAKRQACVTTSSCEAEYVASCHTTKEAIWLRQLLASFGYKQQPTCIYSDNNGSISLTRDPSFHARSKHIDIQYHYTRERVEDGDVTFRHLPGTEMPADILTKGLPRHKHWKFVPMLGLRGSSQWDKLTSSH
jgi:hypothetical protein